MIAGQAKNLNPEFGIADVPADANAGNVSRSRYYNNPKV